ncbi:MAG: response regulator [Phenylobacterium sp.]|jgi:two-component system response regulator FixJ|uniref:response regulator FixJ n=1 Tax=unclassified Phenylobacterium TaxID=2640670 RepID=UPI0008C23DC0|nr:MULTISPECIES: response regulator FixJ [unclassified Phenylobacterium]MBJ7409890.1 response regulator [Phenylobacterium sp.]OHB28456.1 MAG: DNA-binding response regulator [Phenylobacterium sp. RIFCSPHIGHO2_01_FULL_69_31]
MTLGGTVHIIDDDDAVRDSLATLLDASGFAVSAYASAAAFLDGIETAVSGCVVTDVCMPEISGLELLRRLSDRLPQFPVIVLTGEADVPTAVEALKNGALDLIEKPYSAETIVAAVRQALTQLEVRSDLDSRRNEAAERLAALSAREREVLDGVVRGLSNKEIARELGISPRTVEAYRANLMMKMGADSLSDLVRMAIEASAGR